MVTRTFVYDDNYEHSLSKSRIIAIMLKIYYKNFKSKHSYIYPLLSDQSIRNIFKCINILTRINYPNKIEEATHEIEYEDISLNDILSEIAKAELIPSYRDPVSILDIEETLDKPDAINVFLTAISLNNKTKHNISDDYEDVYKCISQNKFKGLECHIRKPKINFIKKFLEENKNKFYCGVHGHSYNPV